MEEGIVSGNGLLLRLPEARLCRMSTLSSGRLAAYCICFSSTETVRKRLLVSWARVETAFMEKGGGSGRGMGNLMISCGFRMTSGTLAMI
jgi:hypothetical protein